MEIYLDDCSDDDDLIAYLSRAGHTVYSPRGEGTLGASDSRHLEHAAAHGYTLLTHNPADFRELHEAWRALGRSHSGILVIYQDNVKGKDMQLADIVHAIGNLLASGLPIPNELHVLNHWR
jgi:hypothetical protein